MLPYGSRPNSPPKLAKLSAQSWLGRDEVDQVEYLVAGPATLFRPVKVDLSRFGDQLGQVCLILNRFVFKYVFDVRNTY